MLAAFQATLFRVGLATERRRSGLVPKDVQTGGHTYHYLERTGPGDVIVLLHGFAVRIRLQHCFGAYFECVRRIG